MYEEALTGPCIVAFAMEDPGASARLFKDFAKEQEAFEIKALSVGGKRFLLSRLMRLLSCLPEMKRSRC